MAIGSRITHGTLAIQCKLHYSMHTHTHISFSPWLMLFLPLFLKVIISVTTRTMMSMTLMNMRPPINPPTTTPMLQATETKKAI